MKKILLLLSVIFLIGCDSHIQVIGGVRESGLIEGNYNGKFFVAKNHPGYSSGYVGEMLIHKDSIIWREK